MKHAATSKTATANAAHGAASFRTLLVFSLGDSGVIIISCRDVGSQRCISLYKSCAKSVGIRNAVKYERSNLLARFTFNQPVNLIAQSDKIRSN